MKSKKPSIQEQRKKKKGVPFPFVRPDMNLDGKVDKADIIRRARRRLSVVKALRERLINEGMIDYEVEKSEGDHEGIMAKADLLAIHKKAGELYNMIREDEELEGWIQSKITKAADYVNAVHNHLSYEKTKPMSIGSGMGTPADTDMRVNENVSESAPVGWKKTVERMKKRKEIDNPFALAHWMKKKGFTPKKGK